MSHQPRTFPMHNRRTFLHYAAAVGVAGTLGPLVTAPPATAHTGTAASAESYAGLRTKWRELLVGRTINTSDPRFAARLQALGDNAQALQDAIVREPGRDRVFTEDPLVGTERNLSSTYSQLRTMATAFATPGQRMHQDPDLLADVLEGMKTTHDLIYNVDQLPFGNGWYWQMGASRALMDTCTLLYEHVDPADLADYVAAVDHFVPDPYHWGIPASCNANPTPENCVPRALSTGANRVDLCRAIAVRGILGENDAKIARASEGLADVLDYVTYDVTEGDVNSLDRDGFYQDGSYIQHRKIPYTGTYGSILLDGLSRLATLLADSSWAITNQQILFDAIDRTYAPVMHNGRMMDFVRGRAIANSRTRDHENGHNTVEAILRVADGVEPIDPEAAQRWRAMSKGWIARDTYDSFLEGAALPDLATITRVLDDDAIPAQEQADAFIMFAAMDRAVQHHAGWAYAISMASKRIAYYEHSGQDNNRGFHTGAGMTYLYNADNAQFTDEFWPTVNVYRLPGTTVDSKPLPDRAGADTTPPSAAWVGGASLDDEYGAVGMHLQGLHSTLEARKSWFCLDDSTVALGAGITGGGPDHPVETTVENRNLGADGDHELLLDGEPQPLEQGWATSREVQWAHLEGTGGYVFPGGADLRVLREKRTGRWEDIGANRDGDGPIPRTRRYLTMWFDHGVQPDDGTYAYVVLPDATPEETRRRARRQDAEILANSRDLQAVRLRRPHLVAANFWAPGSIGGVTAEAPCSVLLRRGSRGSLTLAVAEPTQELDELSVTLSLPGTAWSWQADETITVDAVRPRLRLTINTDKAFGRTHSISLFRP